MISYLPVETYNLIFMYLDQQELKACSLVSRRWHDLSSIYLFRNVYLKFQSTQESFHDALLHNSKGELVKYLTFSRNANPVTALSTSQFLYILSRCPHLEFLGMEYNTCYLNALSRYDDIQLPKLRVLFDSSHTQLMTGEAASRCCYKFRSSLTKLVLHNTSDDRFIRSMGGLGTFLSGFCLLTDLTMTSFMTDKENDYFSIVMDHCHTLTHFQCYHPTALTHPPPSPRVYPRLRHLTVCLSALTPSYVTYINQTFIHLSTLAFHMSYPTQPSVELMESATKTIMDRLHHLQEITVVCRSKTMSDTRRLLASAAHNNPGTNTSLNVSYSMHADPTCRWRLTPTKLHMAIEIPRHPHRLQYQVFLADLGDMLDEFTMDSNDQEFGFRLYDEDIAVFPTLAESIHDCNQINLVSYLCPQLKHFEFMGNLFQFDNHLSVVNTSVTTLKVGYRHTLDHSFLTFISGCFPHLRQLAIHTPYFDCHIGKVTAAGNVVDIHMRNLCLDQFQLQKRSIGKRNHLFIVVQENKVHYLKLHEHKLKGISLTEFESLRQSMCSFIPRLHFKRIRQFVVSAYQSKHHHSYSME
ncbi:hypothetical protein BDB01DRAFT_370708 [Pilobolus umbonatus]|nr:hypothetical protein BDB01DRAFT_370708 [Pilobolus umbonatus]